MEVVDITVVVPLMILQAPLVSRVNALHVGHQVSKSRGNERTAQREPGKPTENARHDSMRGGFDLDGKRCKRCLLDERLTSLRVAAALEKFMRKHPSNCMATESD